MHSLPTWLVPVLMAVLLLAGLALPWRWAGLILLVPALFLGWLLALSWPLVSASGRLLRSTAIAAVTAGLVLLLLVLPAEYNIDPTGVGRALGLTALSGSTRTLQVKDVIGGNRRYREIEIPAAGEPTPLRGAIQSEVLKEVLDAIAGLPLIYREPFVLRHLEEWSYAEIGDVLNLSVETVETRLVRARRLLREMLQGKVES